MDRVIRYHHTLFKLVLAALFGFGLGWGVWISDWWMDFPARLGFVGPLYETHVVAIWLIIPLALLLVIHFEHRPLYALFLCLLINVEYWGIWQVCRFYFEHDGNMPIRQFLFGPAPGGCGFTHALYYIPISAAIVCILSVVAERLSPRIIQDGTLCPYCGYCLRGLEELRCPECGRRPDPDHMKPTKW